MNTRNSGMSSVFMSAKPCFKFSNSCSLPGAPEQLKGYLLYLCHFGKTRAEIIKTFIEVLMVSFDKDCRLYTWSLPPLCCYVGKWYVRTHWGRWTWLQDRYTWTYPGSICSQVPQPPPTAGGEPPRRHRTLQQQCTLMYVYTTPKQLLSNPHRYTNPHFRNLLI